LKRETMGKVEYASCPMCGRLIPLKHRKRGMKRETLSTESEKGELDFTNVDLDGDLFQVREIGGRGSGSNLVERMTIEEAREDERFERLVDQMREQARKILEI